MNRTGSKPGRRISRPTTRFLCRWVPKRAAARVYTRRDAARIVCRVLNQGGAAVSVMAGSTEGGEVLKTAPVTLGQIIAEVRSICPKVSGPTEFDVASAAVAEASAVVSSLEENNLVLEQTLRILAIMNAALAALLFATNFSPPLRLIVRPVAAGVQQSLRAFQGTVIGRKAANDVIIDQFRNIRELQIKLAA